MAAAPQQSALSLSGSIEEIELNESDLVRAMESSALIQKIVDDQKALVAPHHGFNSLLRQEHSSQLTLEHLPKQPLASSQQVATWALRAHLGVQVQAWGCSLRVEAHRGWFRLAERTDMCAGLARSRVESLQKASAYDDALRLEVIIGRGAWGAVYKGTV
eukprot:1136823-Pelagomonas_calceolata.AAC.4